MPTTLQKIIDIANTEWIHWGRSTWKVDSGRTNIVSKDDDPVFAKYVIDNYCAVVRDTPLVTAIQNDDYAWSAVGMSYFMKTAGFSRSEFPFSSSHSKFIQHFVAARKNADANAAYWGYRLTEPGLSIAVGDLIGYGRGEGMTQDRANRLFDSASSYKSHTDVVVAVRPGEIDVIGANVMDSVTKKTLKLTTNGQIDDPTHFWFVLLKAQFV
jgi:hypothetical protein